MTEIAETGRPNDGDQVRAKGRPDGPIMIVIAAALGEDHDWEGVRNGICCEWTVGGEQLFEVFRPSQLEVVTKAPPLSGTQQ